MDAPAQLTNLIAHLPLVVLRDITEMMYTYLRVQCRILTTYVGRYVFVLSYLIFLPSTMYSYLIYILLPRQSMRRCAFLITCTLKTMLIDTARVGIVCHRHGCIVVFGPFILGMLTYLHNRQQGIHVCRYPVYIVSGWHQCQLYRYLIVLLATIISILHMTCRDRQSTCDLKFIQVNSLSLPLHRYHAWLRRPYVCNNQKQDKL